MKYLFHLSLLLWLPAFSVKAQTLAGTYMQLLSYSNHPDNILTADANAAALAGIHQPSFGCYGERRFLIRELGWYQCAAAWPVSGGAFALTSIYNGGGPQQQTRFSLLYARTLGPIQAGLHFDYHLRAAKGYGHQGFTTAGGGLLVPLGVSLRTGFQFTCAAGKETALFPAVFSGGLGYDVSHQFFIGCQVSKTEDRPAQVQAGIQYAVLAQLAVRAGFDAATSLYYFGVSLLWPFLRVELTTALHPQLGTTPGLALLYPSKLTP